jgi:hypothetical protein
MCRLSRNSGGLNLLEPQGLVQACNGRVLPFSREEKLCYQWGHVATLQVRPLCEFCAHLPLSLLFTDPAGVLQELSNLGLRPITVARAVLHRPPLSFSLVLVSWSLPGFPPHVFRVLHEYTLKQNPQIISLVQFPGPHRVGKAIAPVQLK